MRRQFGVIPSPEEIASASDAPTPLRRLPEPEPEPRETSGLTSRMLLAYAEREGGPEAVEAILQHAGLAGREAELRDENTWFSLEDKIRLFEALAEVLDDPRATFNMGAAALELGVGDALKVMLRALGTPRIVYQNVIRANAKFSAVHRMQLLELRRERARVRFEDIAGLPVHPLDCLYTQGLLTTIPALFGREPARISHPLCACHGADACIYDLTWHGGGSELRFGAACAGLAAAAIVAPLALAPALLPAGAAVAMASAGAGIRRALRVQSRRWQRVTAELAEQSRATEGLAASLQDLVSDLRLDEVLAKIVENAKSAVGGNEFALLIAGDAGYECRGSDELPDDCAGALEAWAAGRAPESWEPMLIANVRDVPALRRLPDHEKLPIRSLCVAPLTFRGEALGELVALSSSEQSFLPRDLDRLRSYATQAAIALTNARLFADQQRRATRDALTDLLNHREFHLEVAHEIDRCERHAGQFSVVLFDLDGFKSINDSAGHAEGDRVLVGVARAIDGTARTSDRAFRVGGDEFALVLPATRAENATVAAARAQAAAQQVDTRTGVAYGVASWPADGRSKDALLASADRKLYAMKAAAVPARLDAPLRAVGGPAWGGGLRSEPHRRGLAFAHRLSARLMRLNDEAEIARATANGLQAEFGFFLAAVHRVDPDEQLRPVAVAGPFVEQMEDPMSWSQGVGEGVNGRVARTGEPAVIPDTSLDPDFISPDIPVRSRSELVVPIRVGTRLWGVINLDSDRPNAFDADDLLLADTVALAVGTALHRSELIASVEGTFMTTLGALCDALEAKDAYTAAHSDKVANLAEAVAGRLDCGPDETRAIRYAGLLHDIGKIGVPTEILEKPGRLTEEEFETIKEHTVIGARLLESIPFFEEVHPLVRYSHERWDGRGYTQGLAGEAVPLGSRIIAACDAFHAMTSDRPYRPAIGHDEAIDELRTGAGTQFDPRVVDAVIAEVSA
jgi:diguanylate cyclase (GGDEF)-like protein/putative nucleotidyltransferase with HDIG domain